MYSNSVLFLSICALSLGFADAQMDVDPHDDAPSDQQVVPPPAKNPPPPPGDAEPPPSSETEKPPVQPEEHKPSEPEAPLAADPTDDSSSDQEMAPPPSSETEKPPVQPEEQKSSEPEAPLAADPTDDSSSDQEMAPPTSEVNSQTEPAPIIEKSEPQGSAPVIAVYPQKGIHRSKSGFYFTGEWLYWETRQEGMQYATSYKPTVGDMAHAHTHTLQFDWHSGWRLGVGYDLPHDGWDLYTSYTQFSPQAEDNQEGILFPYLMYEGNIEVQATVIDRATARWKLNFHTWDAELGREFLLSKSFTLRPHAGVKGARIDQHAHVHYTGGPVTPPGGTYKIRLDHTFSGFGVRTGFDSTWTLGEGFSLFGNAAGALLWGSFDIDQRQTLLNLPLIQWDDHIRAMAPMMQAMLGVSWDYRFYRNRFHIGLDAALETQYWWGQNVYERFVDSELPISVKTAYDLGFYGLTLSARFDF